MEIIINERTIPDMIRELEHSKFFGKLEIHFQAGHITSMYRTESFRPATKSTDQDHRQNRGEKNDKLNR
jgi:hypothetical protein